MIVAWVHWSDWHEGRASADRNVVLQELVADLERRSEVDSRFKTLNFAIFSGDLTEAAEEVQFNNAADGFLSSVLKASGLKWKDLIVVPGNHDVDWAAHVELDEDFEAELRKDNSSAGDALSLPRNGAKKAALLQPFEQFRAILGKKGAKSPLKGGREYAARYEVKIGSKKVTIVGLNSALLAGRIKDAKGKVDDYGQLLLGEAQIDAAFEGASESDLVLGVMHHPFSWLTEFDALRVRSQLTKRCDVVAHGHEHFPRAEALIGSADSVILLPAGATYHRRMPDDVRFANGYNLTLVDLETGQGTVYLRRWRENVRKWDADIDTSPTGAFDFMLSSFLPRSRVQQRAIAKAMAHHHADLRLRPYKSVDYHMVDELRNLPTKAAQPDGTQALGLLRHHMVHRATIEAGQEEAYRFSCSLNDRVRAIEDQLASRLDETTTVTVGGTKLLPRYENGTLFFECTLAAQESDVLIERVQYFRLHDERILVLGRFAHECKTSWQRAPELKYDFVPVGGMAPLDGSGTTPKNVLGKSKDCLPDEGYLVCWHPRGE